MKIKHFEFSDPFESKWKLSPIEFNPRINLFVGPSGSGKTRVLNMLFNISAAVVAGNTALSGVWEMHFEHKGHDYIWSYSGNRKALAVLKSFSESLSEVLEDGTAVAIYTKVGDKVIFEGTPLPKMIASQMGIHLFKEEDAVAPAYEGFQRLLRRSFSGNDLTHAASVQSYPHSLIKKLDESRTRSIKDIYATQTSLGVTLYLLKKYFPRKFQEVSANFRRVFPDVLNIVISTVGRHMDFAIDAPLALLEERYVAKPTPLNEVSSGMVKVLLMITDVVTAPPGLMYLIDEYENSLGINAIDFFPEFLLEHGQDIQFIITSHHPFLINEIPSTEWYIFSRKGSEIQVTFGEKITKRYSKSKQQRFVQLMNDPAFTGRSK